MSETRRFEHEIEIPGSPGEVWRALTEASELVRWFPFEAEVEPRVGGKYRPDTVRTAQRWGVPPVVEVVRVEGAIVAGRSRSGPTDLAGAETGGRSDLQGFDYSQSCDCRRNKAGQQYPGNRRPGAAISPQPMGSDREHRHTGR